MPSIRDKYGHTALITGASSGIGKAFAEAFAGMGINLILVARRENLLNEISAELVSRNPVTVTIIPQDLNQADASEHIARRVADAPLEVDILVNNAGFGAYGEFDVLDLNRQLAMVEVNCRQVVALAHHFIPAMKRRRRGAVITVSSALAFFPTCHFAVYSATKAFDLLFGEALYGELKPYGVDAIAIAPTLTKTNFQSESRMQPMPIAMRRPEQVVRTTLKHLGRRSSVVDGWTTRLALAALLFFPRTWVLELSRRFMSLRPSGPSTEQR